MVEGIDLISIYKKSVIYVTFYVLALFSLSLFLACLHQEQSLSITVKLVTVILFLLVMYLVFRYRSLIYHIKINRIDILVIALIIGISILCYIYHHELMLGDYDTGQYILKSLKLSSYLQYDPYRLGAYSVLLAMPALLWSKLNCFIVNPILLFLSLSFIYFICLEISDKRVVGLIVVLIIGLSYPVTWFFRETLNTDAWFFLFFVILYFLIMFSKTSRHSFLLISLFTASMALLCRIEALPLFGILILLYFIVSFIVLWKRRSRLTIRGHNIPETIFIIIVLLLFMLNLYSYYWHLFPQGNFEYTISPFIKAIKNTFVSQSSNSSSALLYDTSAPTYKTYLFTYIIDTFNAYGLLIFIVGSIFAAIYILRKSFRKIKSIFRSPLFIVFSFALVYLAYFMIEPATSFVQPWFLRHFMVPIAAMIIVSICGVFQMAFISKKLMCLIVYLLLIVIICNSAPIMFFSEYQGSYQALSSLSDSITGSKNTNTILVSTNSYNNNYATSLRIMSNLSWGEFFKQNNLEVINSSYMNDVNSSIYILSHYDLRGQESRFPVLDGRSLVLVKHEVLNTQRLFYPREAQDYAKNWLIPPIHLELGYGPFKTTINQLPPSYTYDIQYNFYLFRLVNNE